MYSHTAGRHSCYFGGHAGIDQTTMAVCTVEAAPGGEKWWRSGTVAVVPHPVGTLYLVGALQRFSEPRIAALGAKVPGPVQRSAAEFSLQQPYMHVSGAFAGRLATRAEKKTVSGECPTGNSALPPRCVSCTESSWLQIAALLQGMVEIGGREWLRARCR